VLGWPEAGVERIVEGLLGGAVLPESPDLPPVEIALGSGERAWVTMPDGTERNVAAGDLAAFDMRDLAFLRLYAPLPLLEKVSLLVVPLEGAAAEIRAALDWTFARADMTLWCAARLDGADGALWPFLPEPMRDHAFLALTGRRGPPPGGTARYDAGSYFAEMRDLSEGPDREQRVARLRAALLAHVSRARREDLEGALVFLDHHLNEQARADRAVPYAVPEEHGAPEAGVGELGEAPPERDAPRAAAGGAAQSPIDIAPAVAAGEGADVAAEAEDAAGRIVDFIAYRANALAEIRARASGAGQALPPAPAQLDHCAETIEACADIAAPGRGALADLLAEAGELMVLLQLEGTEAATVDSLALLLQLRRECAALRCA